MYYPYIYGQMIEMKPYTLSLKAGDIVDIDRSHVAKDSRVLAIVTETFTDDVCMIKWLKCDVKPYLCDNEYEDLLNPKKAVLATDKVIKACNLEHYRNNQLGKLGI